MNKKVKTIISFVDPKKIKYINKEIDLIENYNKNNPLDQITFKCLPLWAPETWNGLKDSNQREK